MAPVARGYRQRPEHVRKRIAARLRTLREKVRGPGADTLREWYVVERQTCVDIGARLQKDPKTIWAWLRFYGIATRGRGEQAHAGTFRKGQRSTFTGKRHTAKNRRKFRAHALADGRRPWGKNGAPRNRGKMGAATSNWRGGVTPERQAFYSSEPWRIACIAVWKRANAKCERCGAHHNTAARRGTFHVHHVVSFAVQSLRADVSNLALLCKTCHLFVHSNRNTTREFLRDHVEFKWRRR